MANKKIAPEDRKEFIANVNEWLKLVFNPDNCNKEGKELAETFRKFRIPLWPVEAFAKSMLYDIDHDGFATLDDFIEYSQGASVAPASIFVHLNGLEKRNGRYYEPGFDVRQVATPCAMFSYFVHILRDFRKDQTNNLNYFADDMLSRHRLSRHDLLELAWGHPISDNFRRLIKDYIGIADNFRIETLETIKKISPLLEPRYRLSLEIIFNLYLMVFERIDPEHGTFSTEDLNPTPGETKERVYQTINQFNI
jgi:phytoene/squalene synthetase